MKVPRGRGLNLTDGMILVAATAVGLSPAPAVLMDWKVVAPRQLAFSDDYYMTFDYSAWVLSPILVAWSLAILALRLRRPRPSWRILARQPGMVGGLSAAVMGLVMFAIYGIKHAISGYGFHRMFQYLPQSIAPAVAGAWLTLWMGRRWRPERGPIDGLGRIVGLIWISLYLIRWSILFIRD